MDETVTKGEEEEHGETGKKNAGEATYSSPTIARCDAILPSSKPNARLTSAKVPPISDRPASCDSLSQTCKAAASNVDQPLLPFANRDAPFLVFLVVGRFACDLLSGDSDRTCLRPNMKRNLTGNHAITRTISMHRLLPLLYCSMLLSSTYVHPSWPTNCVRATGIFSGLDSRNMTVVNDHSHMIAAR